MCTAQHSLQARLAWEPSTNIWHCPQGTHPLLTTALAHTEDVPEQRRKGSPCKSRSSWQLFQCHCSSHTAWRGPGFQLDALQPRKKNAIQLWTQLPGVLYFCLLVEREQNSDHCAVFPQSHSSSNTDVLQGLIWSSQELPHAVLPHASLLQLCFFVILETVPLFS